MSDDPAMEFNTFLHLSAEEIAQLVRKAGPQVCVFPINGTRRWFALEHDSKDLSDPITAYMDSSTKAHISLYRLLFDHGLDTLITPTLGSEILLRGEEYMGQIGAEGLARLATGQDFLDFYKEYDVRVHFYGDYRRSLEGTPYEHLIALFDDATRITRNCSSHRLFFGVFAEDGVGPIAQLSIDYFQKSGNAPDQNSLIKLYYGEAIPPATLFIGFGQFWVFDYPLLSNGAEDLYFTVAPSPYLNEESLRSILYDHLYRRLSKEPDYSALSTLERGWLRDFYKRNSKKVFGTGKLFSGIWIPQDPFLKADKE